ncbi:hypothetical protein A2164_03780 [Candidatus Curtissbacteria bacterium RBG_13_35_7]|uniref:Glycosyl transferase family 1 domain-containing protein n=1 Tax=Candidatus Curtissbacteria bacterium RBG_13_35_7 TaxID=1797705 RepID=A0A1F5G355_9BACT|nr:MAG: hypothetical protein A2164_03780 [Candidatus Curtissbacteria bacterium RBG_13_35_7]
MKKTDRAVLYFGSYDPEYSRNRIIKKGLTANKLEVFEAIATGLLPARYLELTRQFLKYKDRIGSIIVGFPGHYDVPLAYILGKLFGKKVFYDIFASTYETYVLDREVISKKSFRSKFFYFIDWLGLKLADYIIVDTIAHGKFYTQLYGLKPKKQIVIYVGSDTNYFYPRKVKEETDVLFYGSYQPLQGVEVIIKAASKLPDIKFKLIGEGQTKKSAQKLANRLKLTNVQFINWLPLNELAKEISKAKVILGIFGKSQKAQSVIPNKVYDALASRKAVITTETQATKEIFLNNKNIIVVTQANSNFLTASVLHLINNNNLRKSISSNGYQLFKERFLPEKVVLNLTKLLVNEQS